MWHCFRLKGGLIYGKLLFCSEWTQPRCADVCLTFEFFRHTRLLKNAANVVNVAFTRQILFVVKQHIMRFTCPRFAENPNVSHLPVTAPPRLFPVCRDCKTEKKRAHYESVLTLNLTCTYLLAIFSKGHDTHGGKKKYPNKPEGGERRAPSGGRMRGW